jgi:hypothetical protein
LHAFVFQSKFAGTDSGLAGEFSQVLRRNLHHSSTGEMSCRLALMLSMPRLKGPSCLTSPRLAVLMPKLSIRWIFISDRVSTRRPLCVCRKRLRGMVTSCHPPFLQRAGKELESCICGAGIACLREADALHADIVQPESSCCGAQYVESSLPYI